MGLLKTLLSVAAVLSLTSAQSNIRITALGDSITGNPGCWRALLWQKLVAGGINLDPATNFVGTLNQDGCGFTFNAKHEGHGGFLATGIVRDNQLPGWLAVSKPDLVQMQLGTNDVWSNIAPATIVAALDVLVDQMRANNPKMRILVAQITPMLPSGCTDCPQRVANYNAAIAAWAPGKSTSASKITVVDCATGFDTTTDTTDGVHPNNSGNIKLSECWYLPLRNAILEFGGGSTPVTSTTLRTSTRSTTTVTTRSATAPVVTSTSRAVTTSAVRTTTTTTSSASGNSGTVQKWGQCGGMGYTGPTVCVGSTCTFSNAWYSQCL